MRIYRTADYTAMSHKAAVLIATQILHKPNAVLGLATGSTPIGAYKKLVEWYNKGELDFSEITTVNLDEYKGLPRENDQSYYYFMHKHLFDHINLRPEASHLPDGSELDPNRACRAYNETIQACGGIDLQLLGMGHNGHIGFNEPADSFPKETHCVELAPSTIEANKRFFTSEADVPRQAYTMGIGNIMSARRVLVVVSGNDKAQIVKKAFFGPITPQVPASILQLHPDVILVGDQAALSEL